MIKRLFDFFAALSLLLLLLLPMLVLALAVRIFLGAPVLFRQKRPGWKGRPFILLKFRTMTDERDADGNLLPDEKRLTGFGKFLRASSLDELPELINILKGEMSFVGPRPLLMQYLERYSPEQARRHDVRPGLTGWAQINGRNQTTWEKRFELDVWYVDNHNFLLDLKILFLTFWKVLTRQGINSENHATMQEFMGNSDKSSDDL